SLGASASKTVIFPDTSDLRVNITVGKSTYRPGENASLRMPIADFGGKPVESVLGIAVVDQAVTERARTDEEFGKRQWFSCAFCGNRDESVGEVHLSDLYHLNQANPAPADLDLVAELLVANDGSLLNVNESENLLGSQQAVFDDMFESQIESLQAALDQHYARTLDY